MVKFIVILVSLLGSCSAYAQSTEATEHTNKSLEIYRNIIAIPTVAGRGNVPKMAAYLATEFEQAGFARQDINIIPNGETAALTVHYRGDGSSGKKPILLIGC